MNEQNTTITEADVLAYVAAQRAKYAPLFPELSEAFRAAIYEDSVSLFGWTAFPGVKHHSGYGPTFADAAKDLRYKIGTPDAVAAAKREQAAKLLAEAAALEGRK